MTKPLNGELKDVVTGIGAGEGGSPKFLIDKYIYWEGKWQPLTHALQIKITEGLIRNPKETKP